MRKGQKNNMLARLMCIGLLFLSPLAVSHLNAQKYAVVNTDYVLKSIPDYTSAQKRIDRYVADWQKEITDKIAEMESMRADYDQESYLLPENLKKRRQEEIRNKEQEIRDLQQQYFAAGGELDRRRAELIKPIQDRIYAAIERIANEKNYAFVFDKAGSATVLFANKKYDISDDILELLGVKPGAQQEGKEPDSGKSTEKKGKDSVKPTNPEMRSATGKQPGQRSMPTPLGKTMKQ